MLKLTNIVKNYEVGDEKVCALKGINIEFRKNEFVAILGQSGCGKTTLLNIIGGLDKYTSGDLSIYNRSTKKFKDHDWDTYRNHSVGFVFQSYNLIPHQTVLSNVELALTLSGVGKQERRRRAKEALEKVGLGNQLHKKPNQMSGGQMQRVAIARALVNDPEILLADEPTGALDSQTSVQIMEILKEISKDKLIIMVTHNPELADQYATRTVRLLDGEVISDSNPYEGDENLSRVHEVKHVGKKSKVSMSFFTALSLSLNNLMAKKARTFLTSFAGSIGIIGIALILSVSTGVQMYIDRVQEDTLSSYPITINAEEVDMTSLMLNFMETAEEESESEHELDKIYENQIMYEMMNSVNSLETQSNNLVKFKEFLETSETIKQSASAVTYSYDAPMDVYVKNVDGDIVKSDIVDLMNAIYKGMGISGTEQMMSQFGQISAWQELLPSIEGDSINELMYEQYDLVSGRWPESYDEIVISVSGNNEISDMMLYALGLKTSDEIKDAMMDAANQEQIDVSEVKSWTYEDIMNIDFRVILPSDKYSKMGESYSDVSLTETGIEYLYNSDKAIKLKIVGIIRPNDDAVASFMTGAIGYTSDLTEYIITKNNESEIVKSQLENEDFDVIMGLEFAKEGEEITLEEKIDSVNSWISNASNAEKALVYQELASVPSDEYLQSALSQQMQMMTPEMINSTMVSAITAQTGMSEETVIEYLENMSEEEKNELLVQILSAGIIQQYSAEVSSQLGALSVDEVAMMLDSKELSEAEYLLVFDNHVPSTRSDSTYEENLKLLGYTTLDSPKMINIYASKFEDKDVISEAIENYNAEVSEEDKIQYTDYVAMLMSSITTIISAISYVLIAFVAISLVVSSIMIGIITYISVLERTKEIGILRAVGASKKDISRVFNAETLIVGFGAGALGIGITLLLLIPINYILHTLTGIEILSAVLPTEGAILLIVISMALTLISGLVPSRIAAKKDPVVALRTE